MIFYKSRANYPARRGALRSHIERERHVPASLRIAPEPPSPRACVLAGRATTTLATRRKHHLQHHMARIPRAFPAGRIAHRSTVKSRSERITTSSSASTRHVMRRATRRAVSITRGADRRMQPTRADLTVEGAPDIASDLLITSRLLTSSHRHSS